MTLLVVTCMKKGSKNTKYLDGGKRMNLVKSFGAVVGILVISLILFQGCTSSKDSTSSGSGSILRVQIIPAASFLQHSTSSTWSSTFITVIVRDSNGNLAPAGTVVDIACGGGYLGDGDPAGLGSSITVTTDANGQVQVRYTAPITTTGTVTISAISLGNSGSTIITIT